MYNIKRALIKAITNGTETATIQAQACNVQGWAPITYERVLNGLLKAKQVTKGRQAGVRAEPKVPAEDDDRFAKGTYRAPMEFSRKGNRAVRETYVYPKARLLDLMVDVGDFEGQQVPATARFTKRVDSTTKNAAYEGGFRTVRYYIGEIVIDGVTRSLKVSDQQVARLTAGETSKLYGDNGEGFVARGKKVQA